MISRTGIIVRAIGVIGVTSALVTGVTWAALTSNPVTLTTNTITTATPSLKLWSGNDWVGTTQGFTVTDLVPGKYSKEYPVYFHNDGKVPLKLTVTIPYVPSSGGFNGWENMKVRIIDGEHGAVKNTNMQELLSGSVDMPGNGLEAGTTGNAGVPQTEGNFRVQFEVEKSSITGTQATVGDFSLQFNGTQS